MSLGEIGSAGVIFFSGGVPGLTPNTRRLCGSGRFSHFFSGLTPNTGPGTSKSAQTGEHLSRSPCSPDVASELRGPSNLSRPNSCTGALKVGLRLASFCFAGHLQVATAAYTSSLSISLSFLPLSLSLSLFL